MNKKPVQMSSFRNYYRAFKGSEVSSPPEIYAEELQRNKYHVYLGY
jgi:hypothetical protein